MSLSVDRIVLSVEHQQLLQGVRNEQIALDAFVQHIVQEGQRRAEAVVQKNNDAWKKVAKDLNLDVRHIEYQLSEDGLELVPARVKL
jgi:gamma-glutamylcysteine synthetase